MIDRDLAETYQVQTKVLNQAVKRNIDRFPEPFRFQLTDEEVQQLVTSCDRFRGRSFRHFEQMQESEKLDGAIHENLKLLGFEK